MSKKDVARELFAELEARGLFEYGSVIDTTLVHSIIGIEMPTYAAKSVYARLTIIELNAIDYCRRQLLDQGKYLKGDASGYRILLPSENKAQIEDYVEQANGKLARALKLSRNSKVEDRSDLNQIEARIVLKRDGMRRGATA